MRAPARRPFAAPALAAASLLVVAAFAVLAPDARDAAAMPAQQQPASPWIDHACPNCVLSLAITPDEAWVGTQSGGIRLHDLATGTVTAFGVQDGLGGRGVYEIDVAADGTAWVATHRDVLTSRRTGVSRFDGTGWTAYTAVDGLPSVDVHDIAALPGGAAWFATANGIGHYTPDRWMRYAAAEGLAGTAQSVAVAPDGTVYAGTTEGLFQFDAGRWTAIDMGGLVDPSVVDIAVAPSGTVWALLGRGVGEWAQAGAGGGRAWTFHSVGIVTGNQTTRNDGVSVDAQGRTWVVVDTTAWVREGDDWRQVDDGEDYVNDTGFVAAVLTTGPEGELWLGLLNEGVAHQQGDEWNRILLDTGPSNLVAMSLEVAPDDGLWVGFAAMGNPDNLLDRAQAGVWTRVDSNDGLPTGGVMVCSACLDVDDGGRPWLAFDGWIAWRDGGVWTTATVTDAFGVNAAPISVGADERGGVWVGSRSNGASHFDGTAWRRYTVADGLASNTVSAIAVETRSGADDVVWFGTNAGISRYDGTDWRTFAPPEAPDIDATDIAVDPQAGRVWFAGSGGDAASVAVYDGSSWQAYGAGDGLTGTRAWSLALDAQGRPWAAVSDDADLELGGAAYLDGERWRLLSAADGLISGTAFDIGVDGAGTVWVATMAGVGELPADQVPTPEPTTPTPATATTAPTETATPTATVTGTSVPPTATATGTASAPPTPSPTGTVPPTPIPSETAAPTVTPTGTAAPTETATPTQTATTPAPTDTATPTVGPTETLAPTSVPTGTASPTPPGTCICSVLQGRVPRAAIDDAVANPTTVRGWQQPKVGSKPVSPYNPLRTCLSMARPAAPYHPLFNPLLWRAGCP